MTSHGFMTNWFKLPPAVKRFPEIAGPRGQGI